MTHPTLALADWLDTHSNGPLDNQRKAANLLRTQHAEIQQWKNVFGHLGTAMTTTPLPPLPSRSIIVDNLWEQQYGPYSADEMTEYAAQARADLEAENKRLREVLENLADEFVRVYPIYYYAEPWSHKTNAPLLAARAALKDTK